MAKVQGKKAAATARKSGATKVAARVKKAVTAVKKRVDSRKRPSSVKPAPKPAPKSVAKVTPKPAKPAPKAVKPAAKVVKPTVAKPAKPVAKAAKTAVAAVKTAVAKAAAPVKAVVAPKPALPPRPAAADEKKRTRRPRLRVQSSGTPVAAWFAQPGEKPRPSSFIPAPPRAEAPSLVAAPPASSDRLIRPEDVALETVRTVPVRIDVEQGGGRIYIAVNPQEVTLRIGEGIEWDFRYLGGADVSVDEIIIELEKPSPFGSATFRSRRPGTARPHRQLSGAAQKSAAGKRVQCTIRAMNMFKTELASTRVSVNVTA